MKSRTRWIALGAALSVTTALGSIAYLLMDIGLLWFVTPDPALYPVSGIDVSHHQGHIDWQELSQSDTQFAWIKATEGSDYVDAEFSSNWSGARAAGIVPGAYHFYTFCSTPQEQAKNLLALLPSDAGATLPVVADVELQGNCSKTPSAEQLSQDLSVFLELVEQGTGKRPMIYGTQKFMDTKLSHMELDQYELWVRDIYALPRGDWQVWQYMSRGRLPGVVGPVDMNVFSGSQQEFEAWVAG